MRRHLSGFYFEQIPATDIPQGLPKKQAEEAYLTLQGGEIRYMYHGGEPSAIKGHLLYEGQSLRLDCVSQIENFKFVSATDRASVLSITLEKE